MSSPHLESPFGNCNAGFPSLTYLSLGICESNLSVLQTVDISTRALALVLSSQNFVSSLRSDVLGRASIDVSSRFACAAPYTPGNYNPRELKSNDGIAFARYTKLPAYIHGGFQDRVVLDLLV